MRARLLAHKIVPHPEEGEAKPLDDLVRYHYTQAQAWHLSFASVIDDPGPRLDVAISQYLGHARMAFLLDALAQGLSGQEAADWASVRNHSESAELVWERAERYGLNPAEIKPYKIRPYAVAEDQAKAAGALTEELHEAIGARVAELEKGEQS